MGRKKVELNQTPVPIAGQKIAKVIENRGDHFQVELPDTTKLLVILSSILKNAMYIRKDMYCIIEPFESSTKIQGEIISVLLPVGVEYLKENGYWTWSIENESKEKQTDEEEFVNRNHMYQSDED